MRKAIFLVTLIALCSFQNVGETDLLVMKAAESQLPAYLDEKIQPGNERAYGFAENDDLDLCGVGKPYRMLVFTADFYAAGKLEDDKNYITIKNEWRVPVTVKDTSRALLTVGGNPGNYIITGIGAPALATELQKKAAGSAATDEYYILQVPTLLADFFVTEQNNSFSDARFVPLASAIIAVPEFGRKNSASYSLTEVQQMVKDALPARKK